MITIPPETLTKLLRLRTDLFAWIEKELEEDGHCKTYEGTFEVVFPNYFEERDGYVSPWVVVLRCYLIGPHRHYRWSGKTFGEALSKADRDIRAWMAGDETVRSFDDD